MMYLFAGSGIVIGAVAVLLFLSHKTHTRISQSLRDLESLLENNEGKDD